MGLFLFVKDVGKKKKPTKKKKMTIAKEEKKNTQNRKQDMKKKGKRNKEKEMGGENIETPHVHKTHQIGIMESYASEGVSEGVLDGEEAAAARTEGLEARICSAQRLMTGWTKTLRVEAKKPSRTTCCGVPQ